MIWKIFQGLLLGSSFILWVIGTHPQFAPDIFAWPSDVLQTQAVLETDFQNVALTLSCCLLIFLLFYWKFGKWRPDERTPEGFPLHPPRAFTTPAQYHTWAFLYGIVHITAFLIVVNFPEFIRIFLTLALHILTLSLGPEVIAPLNQPPAAGEEAKWYPLALGMMIIGLYFNNELEARFRAIFHRRAMIPREAENMFKRMRLDFFKEPINADEELKEFLETSKNDPEMPRYFEFELIVGQDQLMDRRLELLPRTEFMLWRLRQRRFAQPINQILNAHGMEFEKILEDVKPLREIAIRMSQQLVQIIDAFRELDQALRDGGLKPNEAFGPLMQDLKHILELPKGQELIVEIPVSRLDDVAARLNREISELGARLAASNDIRLSNYGPSAEQMSSPDEIVPVLRTQIQTVINGLTPLCGYGLQTIDGVLEERNAQVEDITDRTLAFIICAALSASAQADSRFFGALGLRTERPPIRLHHEAAVMVLVPFGMYLLFLSVIGDIQGLASIYQFEKWLIFGAWMIVGSIMMGYYHGSASASLCDHDKPPAFRMLDCSFAYAIVWSVSTIGIFVISMFYGEPDLFRKSAPFCLVACIWGVIAAAATFRARLGVTPIRLWPEMPYALIAVIVALGLVRASKASSGQAAVNTSEEWLWLAAIALSLTVSLQMIIWISLRRESMAGKLVSFFRQERPAASQP